MARPTRMDNPTHVTIGRFVPDRRPWAGFQTLNLTDFHGGLNLRVSDYDLMPYEAADLWNVLLTDLGKPVKRGGLTQVNTTSLSGPPRSMVYWQPQGKNPQIFVVCTNQTTNQGELWSVDLTNGTTTEIGTGLQASGQPAMVPMSGKLCIFDGTKSWFYDGSVFGPLGVAAPSTPPTVTTNTSGTNLNGTYQWAVTFVRANGAESNPSPFTPQTSITNGQAVLSNIPTSSDTTVVGRNIYRIGGTQSVWLRVTSGTTIADNTSQTYTDNASDSSINGNPIMPVANTTPPPGYIACTYNDRMYLAGDPAHPSRVYYSEIGMPDAWGSGFNWEDIDPDQGGSVTGLATVGQSLVMFKNSRPYVMQGQPPYNETIFPTLAPQGCSHPGSVAQTPGGATFLGYDGIYLTDGFTGDIVPDDQNPARRNKLEPLIEAIDYTQPISAVFFDRQYYLAVTANAIRQVIVFDFRHGAWVRFDWQANCLAIDPVRGRLYVGMSTGGIVAQGLSGTSDLGNTIKLYYKTPQIVIQDPGWQKYFRTCAIYGDVTSAQPTITVSVDDGTAAIAFNASFTNPLVLTWNVGYWNQNTWAGGATGSFLAPIGLSGRRVRIEINELSTYPVAISEVSILWRMQRIVM